MKRKTRIAVFVLSMLLMSSVGLAYAESSQLLNDSGLQSMPKVLIGNPQPRKLVVRSCGFSRTADLTAQVTVLASSSIYANYIKAEITVQKLNRTTGVYYDYANPYTRYVRNSDTLNDVSTIRVGSSGTYRFKVVFSEDDAGEVTIFAPMYSNAEGL